MLANLVVSKCHLDRATQYLCVTCERLVASEWAFYLKVERWHSIIKSCIPRQLKPRSSGRKVSHLRISSGDECKYSTRSARRMDTEV